MGKSESHDIVISENFLRALLCSHLVCHPGIASIDWSKPVTQIILKGKAIYIDLEKPKEVTDNGS